jgi:hypothetical protein
MASDPAGEIKKERHVYYHCTGYADKCQGNPATCRRHYVREELLEKQFTMLLGRLQFDDEVLAWVHEALHASHADERREHEEAIRHLQGEHRRLGDRINAMYIDKLDGRVDAAFFDKMSAEWREEQNRFLREIERHEAAEQSYMDEGVQILELARNAQRLFERQEPRQKRRLLNFVLSNCTWLPEPSNRARRHPWAPPSVEHVFAEQKDRMGLFIRTIGIARATSRNAPHPTTRKRPRETLRPFAPRTQTFGVSGCRRCLRRVANARKFQDYSGERGNYKYAAIWDSNHD